MRWLRIAEAGPRSLRVLPARALGLILLAGLVSFPVAAEEAAAVRPRTCLVLSGGGARGAAHVGVIQTLEDLRIPIDCIAGTSMGAIVGGAYASGMSPAVMAETFRRIDWEDMLDDSPPRKRAHFRRKQDDQLPLFEFELGVSRSGFEAPVGLISGQKISFFLRRLALHALTIDHFDELRIPFRAVAADLGSGEPVTIGDGSLPEALRASMAIPGVFSPVERDGLLLVDGGLAQNVPVEAARAMGAERIIAIDIGTPRRQLRGDEDIVGVLSQTLSVLNNRNSEASIAKLTERDLLIQPDLGEMNAFGFDEVSEAIALGELAAHGFTDRLAEFSVEEDEFADYLARQRLPEDAPLPAIRIDEVATSGSERVYRKQITGRIHTQPGTTLDLETVKDDLDRIYQIGEFDQVEFAVVEDEEFNRLEIRTHDKSWGPHYLRTGMTFSSDLEGESDFLALAHYRRTQLNRLGAEWKTTIATGGTNRVATEFFQPLDYKGFWFIRPRLEIEQDQLVDAAGVAGEVDYDTYTVGLDVGVHLKNYAELSFGVEYGKFDIKTQLLGRLQEQRAGLAATVIFDQVNDTAFPTRGSLGVLDLFRSSTSLGADHEYERIELGFFQAWGKRRNTYFAQLEAGSGLGSDVPIFDNFRLGGMFRLSGLEPDELTGNVLGYFGVGYFRKVGKFYLGASLEAGNVWQDEESAAIDDLIQSAVVFLGRNTIVGPLYIGYGATEDGDESYYLYLGRFL